ncbi:MAG: ATP-binding protein [Vicinamibacterales bacterium]
MPDLRLGPEHLGAVAPFLLAFRRDLTVRALGPSWSHADPEARPGQSIGDLVRIDRPVCPVDFDELSRRVSSTLFLSVRRTGLPLRGPLVRVNDDLLVFLGSLWLTNTRDLEQHGVSMDDLTHQDRDFLFALQSKDSAIADARRIAAQMTEQQMRERRATQSAVVQYQVTRVLADAPSLEAAAPDLVHALCDLVGWQCGAVWQIDRRDPDYLRPIGTWTRPGTTTTFEAATRARRFVRGEGLPGRVWASGQAVWVEDVTTDPNFPRAPAALASGLRGAFALPILLPERTPGAPTGVAGVIEAFGASSDPPEAGLLDVMSALGSQIGQFLHRRRAEAALRESEERLRLIIDSAIDAVVIIDARGIVHAWNPQAERTFGWTATEAIGRELADLIVPPALREAHKAGMRRYRETGEGRVIGQRLELPAIDKHGREFVVELSISPVHRADARVDDGRSGGWPVLFSGFLRDISDRREAEAALRRAKEEAEAAAAAKSDFLATMSHEIRTPMNAIIGLTGLTLDSDVPEQARRYLTTVRESGEALLTIINDILDFSKIDAGQLVLEQIVFAPADLLGDVVDLFRPSAEEKGLVLEMVSLPAVPAAVEADPSRLRQILSNLIANAVKFTQHGRIVVTQDYRDAALVLVVRDTGVGIDRDALSRLFRPFTQADSSMSRRYGGTGLGLAISDRLTRLMGGSIAVHSVEGEGSEFTVVVPVTEVSADTLPPRAESRVSHVSPEAAARVRALIVEDNPANQVVAAAMLRRLGIRADKAATGKEAVEAVARVPYDVILMDCQMPEMDGYEAARQIRALAEREGRPRVPMIAMTANVLKGERERCLAAGMDDFLPKPVRLPELSAALEHWVPGLTAPAVADVGGSEGTSHTPVPRQASERIAALRDMLGTEWAETVRVFESHSRETVELLRGAAAAGDTRELYRLAHLLRGGASMMGAAGVETLAAGIERDIEHGSTDADWCARVSAVAAELERVLPEYQ